MGNRVVITGGGGFIGSHLVDSYVRDRYHVTVIDNFSTGEHFVDGYNKSLLPVDLSVSQDMSMIEQALEAADIVFHLAAQSIVSEAAKNPLDNCLDSFLDSILFRRCFFKRLIFRLPPFIFLYCLVIFW